MKSIEVLKQKLTDKNTLIYENVQGVSQEVGFQWNQPATSEEIEKFESENSITLPASFKEFLKISNGAVLFEDIEYGGWGCKILSLNELMSVTSERREWGYDLKEQWLVFAEWIGDSDLIVFDLEKCRSGKGAYIIDGDTGYPPDEWKYILGDFEMWINRLIVTYGDKYWRWY